MPSVLVVKVPYPDHSDFATHGWNDVDPPTDLVWLAARPIAEDHIEIDGNDWFVRRVVLQVGEQPIRAYAQFNGKAEA